MPRQPQQRFVDLSVGEVSLVDSPANEQMFNVVKSLNTEDCDMADAAQKEVTKSEPNAETVPVEVAKATNEAVEKAMAQVTQLVESISKAVSEPEAEAPEADVSKSDEAEVDTEKGVTKEEKAMRAGMRTKLEKDMTSKGLEGDALKSAVDVAMRALAGQGAFKPGGSAEPPEGKGKMPMKTKKSMDGEAAPEMDAQSIVQETIKQISAGLQGAQALSAPAAQEALKNAIETLQNLMKMMSMQQVPNGGSPKTTVPTSPMYGGATTMVLTKSLEGIKEALAEVAEVTKSLSTRVEEIEKTRAPSTSGGGADETPAPVKKSMWSGVL